MGRDSARRKGNGSGRDPGGFVALPWSVIDSDAYRNCSANARALLIEVARQFHRDDNGRLLLSRKYLSTRGWTSSDMITKAKRELLDNRLIHETVQGQRLPARIAGWYAITWQALDRLPGLDPDKVLTFVRGAYRDVAAKSAVPPHGTERPKFTVPPDGTEKRSTVPSHGTEAAASVPSHGTEKAENDRPPVPPHGTPLERPSTGATSAPSPARSSRSSEPSNRSRRGPAKGLKKRTVPSTRKKRATNGAIGDAVLAFVKERGKVERVEVVKHASKHGAASSVYAAIDRLVDRGQLIETTVGHFVLGNVGENRR